MARIKRQAEPVKRSVRVERTNQYSDDPIPVKDDTTQEPVEVDSRFARVRMGAGLTKSLGNYESLRVDVSIEMPCAPEEVDDVAEELGEKVSELLDAEIESYMG